MEKSLARNKNFRINFNRLSAKDKSEIIALASLEIGALMTSSAFIYPTIAGMTAAGTYSVGVSGTFGIYTHSFNNMTM